MVEVDVVIVGGGPAGAACAKDLVEAGLSVAVVERSPFPRDKPCAGWITPRVLDLLGLAPADYPAGLVLQPIAAFDVGVVGQPPRRVEFATTVSHAIRRCEFDQVLLSRSGARVVIGEVGAHLRREGDRWRVNGLASAPVLIGAGGHHCPVARLLNGAEPHGAGLVLAQVTEFRLQGEDARRCRVEPGVPMLSFCRDRAGYGWCLRKGDYLNVGFGRLSGPDFAAHLAAFREWVQGAVLHGIGVPGRWQGHAYRVWHAPQRRMVGDAVLLAGDAAGLADPVSGEGISAAIESGRMAAFYLLSAGGHYSREALAPYARAVTARLGEPRSAGGPPAGLAAVLTAAVGRALLRSPRFLRHIVLERWFLHRSRKPFGFPPIGNAM